MKKLHICVALLLLVTLASAAPFEKQRNDTSGRSVVGKVMDRNETLLPNAVVYLTNPRTRAVKTYIVGQDGTYRFPSLSPNTDYEVYAQFNCKKSDSKSVSQFDNRQQVVINLRVDAK